MRRIFRLSEPCRLSHKCEYYRKGSMTCSDDDEAVHYCGVLRAVMTTTA